MRIGVESLSPSLSALATEFFGIAADDLPSEQDLQQCLVAEGVRLALDSDAAQRDENGWPVMHVLSLRNWVERKLRAVVPALKNGDPEQDLFSDVLSAGKGANMVFLGDVIELANGYYSPAPTRRVVVDASFSVLVSGLPTRYFSDAGLKIVLAGVGRRLRGHPKTEASGPSIPPQDRQSYVGITQGRTFDQEALEAMIQSEGLDPWTPAKGWLCYQGNRGAFDFEWDPKDELFATPLGFLSLWKVPNDFGGVREYRLRIRRGGQDRTVRVPMRLFKHVALILDKWADSPRVATLSHGASGATLVVNFRPPAAQLRWLHAVGARWLAPEAGTIRWFVPAESVSTIAEMFGELPLKIEEVGKR